MLRLDIFSVLRIGTGQLIEVLPARLLPLSVHQLHLREHLHGLDVLADLLLSKLWNSHLCQVNCDKALQNVPVLHILVQLLYQGCDPLHFALLATVRLEHVSEREVALLHLRQNLLLRGNLLDGLVLPGIACLFRRDGGTECVQVQDLALDPVANVDEGVC